MSKRAMQKGLTTLGVMSGHPVAFLIVAVYAVTWVIFDRESLNFHGAATLATWLMTLFIQRAEHRDTQAIQAKLDELLRAHHDARDELTHLDEKTAEEIEQHRDQARKADR
jgi:low affinity Fe/Cu permease